MSKGQQAAADFIEKQISEHPDKVISWSDITKEVDSKATVKNWMTIRGTLQSFINNGQLERTPDVRVEEYSVIA